MENIHFSGRTSKILWDEFSKYGITREDCYITNVVVDLLPKGEKPTEELRKKNRPRLTKEIAKVKPTLILAVGKIAAEEMLMMKIGSLTDLAGHILGPHDWPPAWIVPCIHPSAVARNPHLKPLFQDCIYAAVEAIKAIEGYKDN
jgi:DNA polymerase